MLTIQKGPEPPTLTQHRKQQHADYDNYADKAALRIALVAEQRGICCYCQSRIRPTPDHMKIEHWQSQSPGKFPERQLDYDNMLGACPGGEKYGEKSLPDTHHCDTAKGDADLCFSVCDTSRPIERKIHYLGDGTIKSDDAVIDQDINSVLNLNLVRLANNRKAVLTAFQARLQRGRRLDPARELPKWDGSQPGDLEPFAGVVVYYLRKRQAKGV